MKRISREKKTFLYTSHITLAKCPIQTFTIAASLIGRELKQIPE